MEGKMNKQCQTCIYYPKDCGYWKLEGKKDKGGNLITLTPSDAENGCPDYRENNESIS